MSLPWLSWSFGRLNQQRKIRKRYVCVCLSHSAFQISLKKAGDSRHRQGLMEVGTGPVQGLIAQGVSPGHACIVLSDHHPPCCCCGLGPLRSHILHLSCKLCTPASVHTTLTSPGATHRPLLSLLSFSSNLSTQPFLPF